MPLTSSMAAMRKLMNQLCTLRGHLNTITCIEKHREYIASTDENGWIILWDLTSHKPVYTWKAHDKTILSTISISAETLITHSKDSEIKIWHLSPDQTQKLSSKLPELKYNEVQYLNNEVNEFLKEFPLPKHTSIPVNTMNFCNIDYQNGMLITPSTIDSNNFDIYYIDPSFDDFKLTRLVHNFSAFDAYKKSTGYIEEINSTAKRDGFGIMMRVKFTTPNKFYVGFESGHLIGLQLVENQHGDSLEDSAHIKSRSVINKDPTVKLIYYSDIHKPNPILSMEYSDDKLIVGSTSRTLSIHPINITEPFKNRVQKSNIKNTGIQSIQHLDNMIYLGLWNGVIKAFDKNLQLQFKYEVPLPKLSNLLTNDAKNEETITSNLKLSTIKVLPPLKVPESKSSYKALLLKKKIAKNLLFAGYSDGKLMVFEIET